VKLIKTHTDQKQQAFMQLYEPVHARLSRFVQSMVWNKDDAKDVIADTVLIAFEHFDNIRNPGAFMYYLFGVASRLVKKKERSKKWLGFITTQHEEEIAADNHNDLGLLKHELYTALGKLNIAQREALTLFEISGFSIKEIAQMQGISESGVKNHLKRGREKLARILSEKTRTGYPAGSTQISSATERRYYEK
jgi:RNA polymerase sigma-70 factor, ECF subfamily